MSALHEFRANILDQDDIFQPEFYCNLVFYGSMKDELQMEPDALEELAAWNTKTWIYVTGNPAANVAPGPDVFARGKPGSPGESTMVSTQHSCVHLSLRQTTLADECSNSNAPVS